MAKKLTDAEARDRLSPQSTTPDQNCAACTPRHFGFDLSVVAGILKGSLRLIHSQRGPLRHQPGAAIKDAYLGRKRSW
jgi:hypothetical protein